MDMKGRICRLRAVEPGDIEVLYAWENDPRIWPVSGTTTPFSQHTLAKFIAEQDFDIFQTRQVRLMIEKTEGETVGILDLFEFDPQHHRAGVGILIHDTAQRGRGYAAEALNLLCDYARTVLDLHQLWCNVGADNAASISLFRKAGFTEVGLKKEWTWTPEGFADELFLQKIL
ncbi:MAG: GNAT family N-acetyltransferase [Alistipes sp.]